MECPSPEKMLSTHPSVLQACRPLPYRRLTAHRTRDEAIAPEGICRHFTQGLCDRLHNPRSCPRGKSPHEPLHRRCRQISLRLRRALLCRRSIGRSSFSTSIEMVALCAERLRPTGLRRNSRWECQEQALALSFNLRAGVEEAVVAPPGRRCPPWAPKRSGAFDAAKDSDQLLDVAVVDHRSAPPAEEILAFGHRFSRLREAVYRWDLWEAAPTSSAGAAPMTGPGRRGAHHSHEPGRPPRAG